MCDDPSGINRRRGIQFWILAAGLAVGMAATVVWLRRQSDETGGLSRVPRQLLEQPAAERT
jgi:hypothetical protein